MEMKWPTIDEISKAVKLPKGYVLEQLRSEEVPQVTQLLRKWYPTIETGSESCHLDPDFYKKNVFLEGGDPDCDIFSMTLKSQGKIAVFYSGMRDPYAGSIIGRLAIVNPEFRGNKLSPLTVVFMEVLGRLMGAGVAYYYVTLMHPYSQMGSEKQGFKLVGIVPAFDRDQIRPGVVKRVFEAIYAKVLVPESEIEYPPKEALLPRTKKLWEFLFGSK